jgi:hypothetical protein
VGEEAISQLRKNKYVGATNFISYLRKHRHRLVNYMYFQAEQLSSIGSGAVESAVKLSRQATTNSRRSMEVPKFTANAATALRLSQSTTCCKCLKSQKIL